MPHYASTLPRGEGIVALASMIFLVTVGVRLAGGGDGIRAIRERLRDTRSRDGLEILLWSLALAYTAFCVVGSAHAEEPFRPFLSFLRYQSVNAPLLLLIAISLARFTPWKLAVVAVPLVWVSIYWQMQMTVAYWAWYWVS